MMAMHIHANGANNGGTARRLPRHATESKMALPKWQIALDESAELVWQCEFPDDIASKLVDKMQEFPQSSFRHLGKRSPAFLTLWNASTHGK